MSKAFCKECGYTVLLEGKEIWTIQEAIEYLLDKQSNHKCDEIKKAHRMNTMEWMT